MIPSSNDFWLSDEPVTKCVPFEGTVLRVTRYSDSTRVRSVGDGTQPELPSEFEWTDQQRRAANAVAKALANNQKNLKECEEDTNND